MMTASKKSKKAHAISKKAASARSVGRKKSRGQKRKVSSKKASSKKNVVTRQKSVSKAASRKRVSRKKPAAKKKVSKKKQVTKKKVSTRKSAKKKVNKKKQVAGKRPSNKKTAAATKSLAPGRAPARRAGRRSDLLSGPIHGISPYSARRGEAYMGAKQLEHFKEILTSWKRELMDEVDRTVHHMQDEAANFPDPNDRATQESEFGLELRTRDRERKLLRKIDSALARIEEGAYGFCDETGEEIGLKRLEARPVATLCVEAQERREMAERQFRDRDDRYR
jgi:DnaK suppressor protein